MNRRKIIKILVTLSVGIIVGCDFKQNKLSNQTFQLNPEDSLKKLILLFGPWSVEQKNNANNFADRFVKSQYAIQSYFPKSEKLIQKLAKKFQEKTIALKEVNLSELSNEEQKLLLMLVKQLYSHNEIRYFASNQSPYGQCQSNPKSYEKSPQRFSKG